MPTAQDDFRGRNRAKRHNGGGLPHGKPPQDTLFPNPVINLDGVRMRIQNNDDMQALPRGNAGITSIIQPTELGETIKNLNDDSIDPQTGMSKIDLVTRLGLFEMPSIMCVDALVSFRFLSQKCLNVTRQKKRLNVSLKGMGRQEIVEIVAGKREHEQKTAGGLFGGLKEKLKGG